MFINRICTIEVQYNYVSLHVAFSNIEPIALQLIRIAYRCDTCVDSAYNIESSSFDIDNGDRLLESIEHNLGEYIHEHLFRCMRFDCWMSIVQDECEFMACVGNGHTGVANFSSSCSATVFGMYEICTDTTAPSILLRFMHMNRMNVFKIVELWPYEQQTNCNMECRIYFGTFHNIPWHTMCCLLLIRFIQSIPPPTKEYSKLPNH